MELMSENYNLTILKQAQDDINEYVDTILYTFDAPKTAKKHADALYKIFRDIQKNPTAYGVRNSISLQQYGLNVRRVNYKKMAIIYTINEDTIYIHRIIASSMITGL